MKLQENDKLEELIEQKWELETEYRESNKKLKCLKRLKRLKIFLPQLLKNIIIFVMSILLIIGILYNDFLRSVFLAIFSIAILPLIIIIDCLEVRIGKSWNKVKKNVKIYINNIKVKNWRVILKN